LGKRRLPEESEESESSIVGGFASMVEDDNVDNVTDSGYTTSEENNSPPIALLDTSFPPRQEPEPVAVNTNLNSLKNLLPTDAAVADLFLKKRKLSSTQASATRKKGKTKLKPTRSLSPGQPEARKLSSKQTRKRRNKRSLPPGRGEAQARERSLSPERGEAQARAPGKRPLAEGESPSNRTRSKDKKRLRE
jgi:hypothetical protein